MNLTEFFLSGCMRRLVRTLFLVLASQHAWAGWGMNDATVVYPLPRAAAEMAHMLAPDTAGAGGRLLPLKYWQRLPVLNQGESPELTYRKLRVVALRFDPCFESAGHCLPQVRLVWQPIEPARYGSSNPRGLEAGDAAVHSFHTLSDAAFRQMMAEYDLLASGPDAARDDQPLQVHPAIRRQGLDGRFARGLEALLRKYCGEANLWRITAMSTQVGGDKWEFLGFDLADGKPVDIVIPRTGNATRQSYFVSLLSEREYTQGRISPAPAGEDNLNRMLRDSRTLAIRDAESLRRLGVSVARIENPALHTPGSMDCVSCHAAQVAGTLLLDKLPRLARDPEIAGLARRSPPTPGGPAVNPARPSVFRALGYFEQFPVLSRRVVNETAAAVARLDAGMPRWGMPAGSREFAVSACGRAEARRVASPSGADCRKPES